MPFIITTRKPECSDPSHDEVRRRAVATLEEAHEAICDTALIPPMDPSATPVAALITEEGGAIAMPDGTVFEVEPTTYANLHRESGRAGRYPHAPDAILQTAIIAAYDDRQAAARVL